jgi:hypothetical protein
MSAAERQTGSLFPPSFDHQIPSWKTSQFELLLHLQALRHISYVAIFFLLSAFTSLASFPSL